MKKSNLLSKVYDFASILLMAMLIVTVIFVFLFKTSVIWGSSMETTLHHGNKVIISSIPGKVNYGDIVTISQPNGYNKVLVKRVIGVGGQKVSFDAETGKTMIDDKIIEEPYIKEPMNMSYYMLDEFVIPEGKLFVMGDNRNNSADSRDPNIGLIDERYVVGKVLYRLGDTKSIYSNIKETKNGK